MTVTTTPGTLVEFVHRGQAVLFFAQDVQDVIQKEHVAGRFYEPQELEIIEAHFPKGGVYVDVGANVGNHVIFISKFCNPGEVIAIEPNVAALRLLNINLALNGVQATIMPFGLSDSPGRAEPRWPNQNLGGARLFANHTGRVRVLPGDELLRNRKIDFLKIDVEAAELAVLAGLKEVIAANRPTIFVEIDNKNAEAATAWVEANSYTIARTFRRYVDNFNMLLLPM